MKASEESVILDPIQVQSEPIVLLDDDDAGMEPAADAIRSVSICSQNVTDD